VFDSLRKMGVVSGSNDSQRWTILLSADGVLGQLPFGGLPGSHEGQYLLEELRLASIAVPQLIPQLIDSGNVRERSGDLLLLGDVAYGKASLEALDANGTKIADQAPRQSYGPWSELSGTRAEIESVSRLFSKTEKMSDGSVFVLSGEAATKGRFVQIASKCSILHLATHGFFDQDLKLTASRPGPSSPVSSVNIGDLVDRLFVYNPGLMTGLVFAGANRSELDRSDSLLTTQEIATLSLAEVELAVLSACRTGLGVIVKGEGLLGVQRAFQIAGVRRTIASLWDVDDFATQRLMELFYRNLWERECTYLDALREAQLELLSNPEMLGEFQAEGVGRTSPKYWAAFQLSGDWR
jgi:CHAT domain-containing protein